MNKIKMGVITVEDFEKVVRVFGFDSPVITAIWNVMANNPNNQDEFKTIYHRNITGKYN